MQKLLFGTLYKFYPLLQSFVKIYYANDKIMLPQRRKPPIAQRFERHAELAVSELSGVH